MPKTSILTDALLAIRDKDTHPVVKGGDFDLEYGLHGHIADEALSEWDKYQSGTYRDCDGSQHAITTEEINY